MLYSNLRWAGPFPLGNFDFAGVPSKSGVYVFTEFNTALKPNAPIPSRPHPDYERTMEMFRNTPCVLYVGKASNLRTRLPGYRFRPYLEIVRRPAGSPPRQVADKHKGRALLHAQQYLNGPIFVRWAESATPIQTESALIRELNPVLNTVGLQLVEPP